MDATIPINASQPGYFSYLVFRNPEYDGTGPLDPITENHFTRLPDISGFTGSPKALFNEIEFLDVLGLIVEHDGHNYVSPLAEVFYGPDGLFIPDDWKAIRLEDRIPLFTRAMNLFIQFVLPGRLIRNRIAHAALSDELQPAVGLQQEELDIEWTLQQIHMFFSGKQWTTADIDELKERYAKAEVKAESEEEKKDGE